MDLLLSLVLNEMKKVKISELAIATGINRTRLYRVINYGKTMRIDEFLKISKALKMDSKERIIWELGRT